MGSGSSRQGLKVPASHTFLLNDPLYTTASNDASGSVSAGGGQLITVPGGGALTTVALELPAAWHARLRAAPRLSRHMEIRVGISCCAARQGGSRKWPQAVFLDAQGAGMSMAELDPDSHATTVAAGWDPNYAEPPSAVRYEHELAAEPLDSTVTLLVKPWMVAGWSTIPVDTSSASSDSSSSARPQIRMTFRGDWSWGSSLVALRAQVWERVALPADTFNPSRDPEHRCVIDGVPVGCTAGQHFEFVPLDEGNIARADRLAVAAAPFVLSSPSGRGGGFGSPLAETTRARRLEQEEIRRLQAENAALDEERRERNQLAAIVADKRLAAEMLSPDGGGKRRPLTLQSPAAYRPAPIISPRDVVASDRGDHDHRTDAEVHAETRRRLALEGGLELTSPGKLPPASTRKASTRQRGIADSSSPYDSSPPLGSPSAVHAGVGGSYTGSGAHIVSPSPAATEQVAIRVAPSPLAITASPRWQEPTQQQQQHSQGSVPRGRLAPLVIHTGESSAPTPQAASAQRRPLPLASDDPFRAHYAPEVDHFAATPAIPSRMGSTYLAAPNTNGVQPFVSSPMALHDDLRASSLIRQHPDPNLNRASSSAAYAQPNFIPTPTLGGQRQFREAYDQ